MSDVMSQAKAALEHAKKFQGSVAKQSGHPYANAPYSMAKKAESSKPGLLDNIKSKIATENKDTADTASGLKWNIDQAEAAKKQ